MHNNSWLFFRHQQNKQVYYCIALHCNVFCCVVLCLTRFNKICHPSQRPRWQVDKEAIGLSRVQQCSSTYNPPS